MRTWRKVRRLAAVYGTALVFIGALVVVEGSGPSPVGDIEDRSSELASEPLGGARGNSAASQKHCDGSEETTGRCADAPLSGSITGECPEGTTLVAKFEWNGSSYVFEKPAGNEGLVTISGNTSGGTWTSTVTIDAVVIKASTDQKVYEYDGGAFSGAFDNSGMTTPSGQPNPDISNIRFCS